MWRLMPVGDDRGAVATIVCILFTTSVFFALGALTLDMGLVYNERREIQNGADAGALALAQSCAENAADCLSDTGPASTPGRYADRNAMDGTTLVTNVCGAGRPPLRACTASSGRWTDCLPLPPAGTNFVEVRTRTRTAGGETFFPRQFARALAGFADDPGTAVPACARASWGGVQSITGGFPFTISWCTWDEATRDRNGDGLRDYAQYPPNPPGTAERTLMKLTASPTCSGVEGTVRGGFGWIDDRPVIDCMADLDVTRTYTGDPGADMTNVCKTTIENYVTNKTTVFLPIFTKAEGTGSGTTYTLHRDGFAAFVITGYRWPGVGTKASWLTGTTSCPPGEKCIFGFFTDGPVPGSFNPVMGGAGMGAYAIGMIG